MSYVSFVIFSFSLFRQLGRTVVLSAILAVCLIASSILLAAERTAWFSDVPLIEGLIVDEQLSFAFDAPSGRILVLLFKTEAVDVELLSSYQGTLAALGWTERDGQFFKGDELLRLEKIDIGGRLLWRMTIFPEAANQLEIR
ncbi:MAG: hypothetical protein CMM80_01885 [Rhodospirillaceae bacterium]|nr:hypothetical protein [Rhodospirillaceae bacterium]|tara:strand:+ start:1885 stop:2310 length:426 start_codon:yes stop_codon:yes gene_type:complete